jgi:hypothetical protein
VEEVLDALPPRPLASAGSARGYDAFSHHPRRPGRVAARLFDALDDDVYGGLTAAQLAPLTGRPQAASCLLRRRDRAPHSPAVSG